VGIVTPDTTTQRTIFDFDSSQLIRLADPQTGKIFTGLSWVVFVLFIAFFGWIVYYLVTGTKNVRDKESEDTTYDTIMPADPPAGNEPTDTPAGSVAEDGAVAGNGTTDTPPASPTTPDSENQ